MEAVAMSLRTEKRAEILARPTGEQFSRSVTSLRTCWIRAYGHATMRVALAFHVDDLLLVGTKQSLTDFLGELSRDMEIKCNEVTTKPTRHLGPRLVKTKSGYIFGVHAAYVEHMLEEFNISALKSTPTLRWARSEVDEKEMPASAAIISTTYWKTSLDRSS